MKERSMEMRRKTEDMLYKRNTEDYLQRINVTNKMASGVSNKTKKLEEKEA